MACIFLLLLLASAHAQLSIEATVLDAKTKAPVPYCAVGIRHKPGIGCLSNEEGVFRLQGYAPGDTLVLSCVGYTPKRIPVAGLKPVLFLEQGVVKLDEVVVLGDNSALYLLFEKCRRQLAQSSEQTSKAYYVLESCVGEQPVELLECYYNARFNNAVLKNLEFKNGRAGIAPLNGRYYVNLNSSKAFTFLNLGNTNELLPALPTQFQTRKLKKLYQLRLKNLMVQDDSIYQIEFTPRDTGGAFYSGEAWIGKRSGDLQKIVLNGTTDRHHPFVPVFPESGSIARVSMQVVKTYAMVGGRNTISHINFNYTVHYEHKHSDGLLNANADTAFDVSSKGLIYFYDRSKPFIPPYFQYNPELTDYRKIASLSYNEAFWNANTGLIYSKNMQRGIAYFKKYGELFNYRNAHEIRTDKKGWIFENNYIPWSATKRIGLKKDIQKDSVQELKPSINLGDHSFKANQYQLKVQLFLDLNPVDNSVQHYSMTVFDIDQSFYRLPEEPVTNCFINIYFDLFEIERLNMERLMARNNLSLTELDQIYKDAQKHIDAQSREYLKEVERGSDLKALKKWNERVLNQLGIDNMALFGIVMPD